MTLPLLDPFDSATDADPAAVEVRNTSRRKPKARLQDVASKPKAKKTDFNPMQQDWFRKRGWTFYRAEKTNTYGACTVDMWGFADYIACHPLDGIALVQTCRYDNGDIVKRERKARKAPELVAWMEAGGRFLLHGWHQPKGPGTRWEVVIRELTLEGRKP
jgi:hypothetical protein